MEEKRKVYGPIALTALCAAGLFAIIYVIRGLYPFGDGSILITDLYSQYVPLLYRFYDVVTGQKNLFIDFSVSGGANLYADTINEVLNPFNYVLLLFGRSQIYQSVNVLLWLYVTAAAASMHFFLAKSFPQSRSWNGILSLCYGFSGYMAYNYQIIKWMYFPVLFPLFVLALGRLIREKKGGVYAVLLAYQLMLSIQLGFMALLFTLFGSGIYLWFCVKKEDRPAAVCRLGAYTAIGLLLSGAVLVPNIAILLSSSRAGENSSYFGVMKQHGLDDLFERLFQIAHPVLLALLVRGMAGRRRSRFSQRPGEEKFLLCLNLFLWLTVLLQPANLLWHMGSYVCFPVRYAYMVLLAGICLVKRMLTEREVVSEAAQRTKSTVPDTGRRTGAEMLPGEAHRTEDAKLAAGRQSAEAVPGGARQAESTKLAAGRQRAEELPGGARQAEDAKLAAGRQSAEAVLEMKLRRKREALCRAVLTAACPLLCLAACLLVFFWEDRIVQGFSSLAISSVCPKETGVVCLVLALFFGAALAASAQSRKLTFLTAALCGICFNLFIFLPPDYSVRLDNEAAYRKMALQAQENQGQEGNPFARAADDPALPLNAALVNGQNSLSGYFPTASQRFKNAMEELGYLVPWVATKAVGGTAVSDAILSRALVFEQEAEALSLNGSSVLARQEALSAVMQGESCINRIAGSSLTADEAGAYHLTIEGRETIYLDPGMTADSFLLTVNGEALEVPEASDAFSPHRIVELGTFYKEGVTVLVTDKNGMPLSADSMEFGLLDRQKWDRAAEAENWAKARMLSEAELTVEEAAGKILVTLEDAEAGQTVFLPVAALDGWRCEQNGKNVDIESVFGGFLGITAASGNNEIALTFVPKGLRTGASMTLAGAACLLAAAVLSLKSRRNGGTQAGQQGEGPAVGRMGVVLGGLYGCLFVGGILVIYVIPAAGLAVYMAAKILGIGG